MVHSAGEARVCRGTSLWRQNSAGVPPSPYCRDPIDCMAQVRPLFAGCHFLPAWLYKGATHSTRPFAATFCLAMPPFAEVPVLHSGVPPTPQGFNLTSNGKASFCGGADTPESPDLQILSIREYTHTHL